MSKEGRINEPYRGGKPYEIQFGIPFKPFVNARRFYHTPKGLEFPYRELKVLLM
jgi:hypothetical protein